LKAERAATVGIAGEYSDPVKRHLPVGGGFLASAGLERWMPVFAPTMVAWDYSPLAKRWRARFAGDLALMSDTEEPLRPGAVMFISADAPAELEVPEPVLRLRYYHQDHLVMNYVKVHWMSFYYLGNVKKAAKSARQLLTQIDGLEQGARALRKATLEVAGAESQLPTYPLQTGDKANGVFVTAEELEYVEKYYSTARRIANEAEAARDQLNKVIAGWDTILAQAKKSGDFTRASGWDAITDLDYRFSKQGSGFRAYLIEARDTADRAASWARTKQFHAAHILGESTPESYKPPTPP
jgi:hypothetical protein